MTPPRLRTAWHPLLVLLLRKLLPTHGFEVIGEFSLTREPLRLDVVVVRKLAEVRPLPLLPGLLDPMPKHLLVSFKGPTDTLDDDDATMLWVYLGLYLIQSGEKNLGAVSVRVVASSVPQKFLDQLRAFGGHLAYKGTGLWEGRLGPCALRLIETQQAFSWEEEHLWHIFSPSLGKTRPPRKMSSLELELYMMLYQQVEQLRSRGDSVMLKDLDLAALSMEEAMAQLMVDMPLEMRLAGLAPEQRLAGLAPEQRLAGLAPEQRLAGLAPEQRLAGLAPEQRLAGLAPEEVGAALGRENALLALPDDLLRQMPDAILATLSPEGREVVRKRTGR